jgi:precorrin-6Y C5,15-methyltransferase (decarboxylating)
MWFGVGSRIAELFGPQNVEVVPHVSAISLACARLGWAIEQTAVLSVVGRAFDRIRRWLSPGRRILLLSADATTPATVAAMLTAAGFGPSSLTVLECLGSAHERRYEGVAHQWHYPPGQSLNVVAIHVNAETTATPLSTVPGLPDTAFVHDGALTKREARALALARLAPLPGHLLWDVGAGSGSIAVEWMRAEPDCLAVAIEARPDRAERIATNATQLGVPDLRVVVGRAPAAFADLPPPQAIFLGGGVTAAGMIDACWAALEVGGRLVAHAVTLEGEQTLACQAGRRGGDLMRLGVHRAQPLGGFTTWRPALPLTQWAVSKQELVG